MVDIAVVVEAAAAAVAEVVGSTIPIDAMILTVSMAIVAAAAAVVAEEVAVEGVVVEVATGVAGTEEVAVAIMAVGEAIMDSSVIRQIDSPPKLKVFPPKMP